MEYRLYEEKKPRFDNAPKKRVELCTHTNLGGGVSPAKELIDRAVQFGHPAIAITDSDAVRAFPEAMKAAEGKPIKVIYGMSARGVETLSDRECFGRPTFLAKDRNGLKELYRLVTFAHTEGLRRENDPVVTRSVIRASRERGGILVGSGIMSELVAADANDEPWDELLRIASNYDYLEIAPCKAHNEAYARMLVRLGEELDIPVCAVGDTHFCDPEDEILLRILNWSKDHDTPEEELTQPLYLRTTEEMLEAFSYLGAEKAYEVVVTNPNRIADMIEPLRPIPEGLYPPVLSSAEEELQQAVKNGAQEKYGDPLPALVGERLEQEMEIIRQHGYATELVIPMRLVRYSEGNGWHVGTRGSVGASLAAYFAGITEVNPLPPHYVCPRCHRAEFLVNGEAGSGFDLPDKNCPACGATMDRDGHDIPPETFWGLNGEKRPDIDLHFASEFQGQARRYLEEMFEPEHVFYAGTVRTYSARVATELVGRYALEHEVALSPEETELLAEGLGGVFRCTGSYPGGLLIVPNGYDAEDFTPVQYAGDNLECGTLVSHFDLIALDDTLIRFDLLGHSAMEMLHSLEETTGILARDVSMTDPEVYSMFTSPEALGVSAADIRCQTGTLALPDFGSEWMIDRLAECRPKSFSELVKLCGLAHGTGAWADNVEELIRSGVCSLADVVSTRDDVMNDLTRKGVDRENAYRMMELVRKAHKTLTEQDEEELRRLGMPAWYIESLRKIWYLFPKAHAVQYTLLAVKLAWYKLHYPAEYYAAYFRAHPRLINQLIRRKNMSITLSMGVSIMGSKTISKEQLDEVLREHALWRKDHKQGKRADLSGYNLNRFDLRGADLSYARLTGASFSEAKLCGADFTRAMMDHAVLDHADLSEAILNEADLYRASVFHADLTRVKAEKADFTFCVMWDSRFAEASMPRASFYGAELCDCDFTSAGMSGCELYGVNMDYARFTKADLTDAHLVYARNTLWADFEDAVLSGVDFTECAIDDDAVEGAKGLYIPMACPEEGTFVAWKKCGDNRIVKLMVPEHALRTGSGRYDCRASEVLILDIFDGDKSCAEAVCLRDDQVVYHPGETVKDKEPFDGSLLHDGAGIHFFLSRGEAERFEYEAPDEEDE